MKLVVDPPELQKASDKFTQLSGDYSDVYNRLMNTARTMGEAWKAADNLAFVDQITGFCDKLKAMTDHLEQAAQALAQQKKNYEDTRDGNVTGVKTLAN
ncbi:MAG: WXG100 family type VII secretion target [Oscillospiraceae bacterium]|nr:WXG100 family type VII secretion target [Oscillospiraceae bacterium]